METILNIDEVRIGGQSGFAITTNDQVITMLIDDYQSCCESWGYFMSEDDIQRFVGSFITDVTLTDISLNTHKLEESGFYEDAGGVIFVNINTSYGTLQFVAYNAHNGYYGHTVNVSSKQLKHEENL